MDFLVLGNSLYDFSIKCHFRAEDISRAEDILIKKKARLLYSIIEMYCQYCDQALNSWQKKDSPLVPVEKQPKQFCKLFHVTSALWILGQFLGNSLPKIRLAVHFLKN